MLQFRRNSKTSIKETINWRSCVFIYSTKPETFLRLPPQSVLTSQNNGSPWSPPRSAPLLHPPHASCHSESGIRIKKHSVQHYKVIRKQFISVITARYPWHIVNNNYMYMQNFIINLWSSWVCSNHTITKIYIYTWLWLLANTWANYYILHFTLYSNPICYSTVIYFALIPSQTA